MEMSGITVGMSCNGYENGIANQIIGLNLNEIFI